MRTTRAIYLLAFTGAAALATLLATPTTSRATLVSVDFQTNTPQGGVSAINFSGVDGQAASASAAFAAANVWNHPALADYTAGTTTNPSFSNLVNSAGDSTNVGISFTGVLTAALDNPHDNVGPDALNNDYFLIDAGGAAPSALYTISGLPANTAVSLFVYAPTFGNRGYTLTTNGTLTTVADNSTANDAALINVTTNALGNITGTWGNIGVEGDWSGFQVSYPATPASTVPDNGATWAMLLSSVGLLAGAQHFYGARRA